MIYFGMVKKALITGITGQDGGYLAELLLGKGYEVYGMYRRASTDSHFERINHLEGGIKLICGEMTEPESLLYVLNTVCPDEIYNLAAQSHVGDSFTQKHYTKNVNFFGVASLLEIIRLRSGVKFYQASTSEMFGGFGTEAQSEETEFLPQSPYAKAKVAAHRIVQMEREKGLFACGGILFNHESPKRGLDFVTRKVTDGLARIELGLPQRKTGKSYLELGNLDAKRDWGFAGDYVEAMWLMMQQEKANDYVIATGETHSIRELVDAAAKNVGRKISWDGKGVDEKGHDQDGNFIVSVNPEFYRPTEVNFLLGDSSKAERELGWKAKVKFEKLIEMMVKSDLEKLSS